MHLPRPASVSIISTVVIICVPVRKCLMLFVGSRLTVLLADVTSLRCNVANSAATSYTDAELVAEGQCTDAKLLTLVSIVQAPPHIVICHG